MDGRRCTLEGANEGDAAAGIVPDTEGDGRAEARLALNLRQCFVAVVDKVENQHGADHVTVRRPNWQSISGTDANDRTLRRDRSCAIVPLQSLDAPS